MEENKLMQAHTRPNSKIMGWQLRRKKGLMGRSQLCQITRWISEVARPGQTYCTDGAQIRVDRAKLAAIIRHNLCNTAQSLQYSIIFVKLHNVCNTAQSMVVLGRRDDRHIIRCKLWRPLVVTEAQGNTATIFIVIEIHPCIRLIRPLFKPVVVSFVLVVFNEEIDWTRVMSCWPRHSSVQAAPRCLVIINPLLLLFYTHVHLL